MMQSDSLAGNNIIKNLRKEWGYDALLAVLFLASASLLMAWQWSPTNAVLWLAIAGGITLHQFW